MNTKLTGKIIAISLILVLSWAWSSAFAQSRLSKKITEGNKLYTNGEYDKALTEYNDAQIEAPTSPEIYFNMGNVFFRQGKYKEAIDSYQKSMEKGDINVEAKAMYNVGNALFQQGQLPKALEYYKQALERNPDDVDTKYNIEYTERMIKEMLSKSKETMKKATEEQKKRQKQEQQSAQASGKKEEKEKAKGEQAQVASRQKEKEGTAEKNRGKGAEAGKKENNKPQGREAGGGKVKAGDKENLSKKDAERFLSAFQRDQKENPLLNQQKSRGGRGYYVEKDW